MKLKVEHTFRDINDFSKVYQPGEVVDFPGERAQNAIHLGVASPIESISIPDVSATAKPRKRAAKAATVETQAEPPVME